MNEIYLLYAIYRTDKRIIAAHPQPAIINALFKKLDPGRPLEVRRLTYNEETGKAEEVGIKYKAGDIVWYWE